MLLLCLDLFFSGEVPFGPVVQLPMSTARPNEYVPPKILHYKINLTSEKEIQSGVAKDEWLV